MRIEAVETLTPIMDALVALLIETVADGASIGFLAPLGEAEATAYWREVDSQLKAGHKLMLAAMEDGNVLGTVQLALEPRPNGRHRAEVQKLMVSPKARGRGTGRALMAAVEDAALQAGRTLLILDTRRGDIADELYARIGYSRAGVIPGYVIDTDGRRSDTCLFYKQLENRTAP